MAFSLNPFYDSHVGHGLIILVELYVNITPTHTHTHMSMTVLRPELNILLPPNSKGGEKYLSRPRSRHAMALRSKLEEIGLVDLMLHY